MYFLKVGDRNKDTCPICMEEVSNSKFKNMSKCKLTFCKTCIEECFKRAPVCPICNIVYGKIVGTQPSGIMVESFQRDIHLPGYDDCGTIRIFYSFLKGKQTVSIKLVLKYLDSLPCCIKNKIFRFVGYYLSPLGNKKQLKY